MNGLGSVHVRAAIPAKHVRPGVSGDVFDQSIKLLRHFVSEEELPDLTVENIQKVLTKVKMHSSDRSVMETPSREIERSGVEYTYPAPDEIQEVVERDEHPLLQEDLGCMVLDSLGKYRVYLPSALARYVAHEEKATSEQSLPFVGTMLLEWHARAQSIWIPKSYHH
ncbi:uncharacterized protein PV07_04974 [Cladophialophora immunda]|uniref:Uncharacterized protein n=1 Tax=Cladophialophora immunda TaxID=569365 RepID=A0A0D2CDB9_9EURO|nr:uncharacterized protein PV07_04974 [Cladophialophora immunda]KIW29138.1 hypothetical protein PV07_04974 [Cladophialophora immunda]